MSFVGRFVDIEDQELRAAHLASLLGRIGFALAGPDPENPFRWRLRPTVPTPQGAT